MNRRTFLGAILATACAPAIVRADSLMRLYPRELRFAERAALPVVDFGNVIETTWRDKSLAIYSYEARDVELLIAPDILDVRRIWLDGRELLLRTFDHSLDLKTGKLTIRALDLTDFGNRLPEFSALARQP